MKSSILSIYKTWLKTATPRQIEAVDAIYAVAEANYTRGGDRVVECMEPSEVLAQIGSPENLKEFCGLHIENALNYREGNDSDHQLEDYKLWKEW